MLSKQIALYLQSQSLGTVGTSLFYGFLPTASGTIAVVYDTGGESPGSRLGYDYPTFQIRTRANAGANTIENAYTKAADIYNVLQSISDVTLNDGTKLVDVTALQSAPISLDKDESGRAEFTLNFRAMIRNKTIYRE
jgi:hypothetical protein